MRSAESDGRSVKSAERVFDVLEQVILHPSGTTFPALAQALNIPKSSLHALLAVMERRQYIETDPDSRRIRLGLRTLEAGQAYLSAQDLIETARGAMAALVAEINETAQLAQLSGRENIYLARVDSSHSLRLQSQPGMRLPAHATGVGKAILAQMSTEALEALYRGAELATFGPKTIASVADLAAELEATRARGFAIDNEEYTPGVFCLAVPVKEPGKAVNCAVSVSVPVTRASLNALAEILPKLAYCALSISRRLGSTSPDRKLSQLTEPDHARQQIETLAASRRYLLPFS